MNPIRAFIPPTPFTCRFVRCRRTYHSAPPMSSLTTAPSHIVLLSGGVESSTLLRLSVLSTPPPTALFFDYGQRAAAQELHASQVQCCSNKVHDLLTLDLRGISNALATRSGERRHIPLHHRNAALLGIAASVAGQQGANRISIAVCKDDTEWYASASREFIEAFGKVGETLGIAIETPLIELGKTDVIKMGLEMGVDYETTWSCMIGRGEVHCGRCGQCKSRRKAMKEAGISERTGFYQGGGGS